MKKTLALVLASALPALAIPASTQLQLVPSDAQFNTFTISASSALGSDTDTMTITGTADIDVNVDPDAHTSTELTVRDGRVNASNFGLTVGSFPFSASVNGSNFSARVFTTTPPGSITPATGIFDANQHEFIFDQGTTTGAVTLDLSVTPIGGRGSGNGTLTLTPSTRDAVFQNYDVVLELPITSNEIVDAGGGLTVTITTTGTIKAAGTLQVPLSDYLAWTIEQGISGATATADSNGDGIPNGIAWALGLDGTANARTSLPMAAPTDPKAFQINLPAGGTAAPLLIEFSDGLSGWNPVPDDRLSTNSNPIPAGSSGQIDVSSAGKTQEFLRFLSTE